MSDDKKTTIAEHLIELRKRLVHCIITLFLLFGISYFFANEIYQFLLQPLMTAYETSGQNIGKIIYTSPAEAFITYIRLSFIAAFFFSLPIIISQLYIFIAPGLYKSERRLILLLSFSSLTLFLLGAALLYYLILPIAFEFFISFEASGSLSAPEISLEAKISEYLGLIIQLFFGFGIAFQLPILLVMLVKFEILSVQTLAKQRKYWIVIMFVIAAVLTPPDAFSQFSLALLMIGLYEISLIFAKRVTKKINHKK